MRPTNPYPHCYWHKDRETWRVHLPGRRITLKREDGTPFLHCQRGTPEFAAAYAQVLAGVESMPKKGLGVMPGTFDALERIRLNPDRIQRRRSSLRIPGGSKRSIRWAMASQRLFANNRKPSTNRKTTNSL